MQTEEYLKAAASALSLPGLPPPYRRLSAAGDKFLVSIQNRSIFVSDFYNLGPDSYNKVFSQNFIVPAMAIRRVGLAGLVWS